MRESEPKLAEARSAYLQSILDTVRDPMLVLDSDLRVMTASRAFCHTFHVRAEDTVGCLVYELGNGQWDIPQLRQALEVILPKHSSFNDFEVSHDFPSIGRRVMLLNARKVWREQNNLEQILLVIQDITERKQIEERLLAAHKQLQSVAAELERSNQDLERFSRVAGHDLRAPLNTIVQFSELLRLRAASVLDQEAQLYLKYILDGGLRMSELLTSLLTYAMVTQAPHDPAPSSLNQACREASDNLTTAIENSHATVHCNLQPETQVRVEKSQLVQILQNFIANAIKYRRPDVAPVVHVEAECHEGGCLLTVRDNGIGIDKKYCEIIFEPFQRLHGNEIPGSGIGLATCKRVVERAGGSIRVDSVPGQGSTFSIFFPDTEAGFLSTRYQ